MRKRITFLLGALILSAQGMVSAANIGICDPAASCGPDFFISSVSADYVFNAGSGVLTITGVAGNASFLPGQLDPAWVHGNTSLQVHHFVGPIPATTVSTNDDFSLSFTVDSSGTVTDGGVVTLNGAVLGDSAGVPFDIAKSFNGTVLDGGLITGGSISQIGWDGKVLDFIGDMDNTSILAAAGYGTFFGGILTLSSTANNIVWNQSWSATGTLDVIVPVPAALWLFVSGGLGLLTVASRKKVTTT